MSVRTALPGADAAKPNEAVEVTLEPVKDPVESALQYAILGVIIIALVGVAYALLAGVINPPAPRTALEAQLVAVQEATKTNPSSGEVWADYVTALTAVGNYGDAQREFARARKLLEGEQLLLLQIAGVDMYLAQEDYDEAYKLAEENITLESTLREAAIKKAQEAGFNVNPKLYGPEIATDVHLGFAKAAAAKKEWEKVVASLTTALEYTPRASDVFYLRGDAYMELGDTEKARADFETALRFNPEFEAARAALEEAGEQ